MKPAIEVCWKKVTTSTGDGLYQARFIKDPNIVDYAITKEEAVRQLLISLKSRGFSDKPEDYEVIYL